MDGVGAPATAENPYPGPRPFERDDAGRFFGRGRDSRDLASLVVAHRVVLFYSASGAGKSSLVNAGVIPLLEEKGFELLPTARVGAALTEDRGNVFTATLTEQLGGGGSIDRALAKRDRPVDEEGEPVPRALVIDQFEELFTAHPEHWADRAGLFDGVAEALEADEGLRVLLVMREEYLAQLEPFGSRRPGGLKTRYRLDRLDRASALEAVTRPVEGTGRSFAPGVAESVVDDLLKLRVDTGTGGIVEVPGEFVEPVHLQVVCSRLWDELPPEVTEIRAEHAQTLADLDAVLAQFYERALWEACSRAHVSFGRLRRWVQKELITPGGTRSTVYRGVDDTEGLPNTALEALEENRLIRAEQRAGALWYELTHDRLIEPIRRSNASYLALEAQRRRTRLVTAAVVAIGLLGASIGAAFTVLTGSGGESVGCTSCSAQFGRVAVDPSVTYSQYRKRVGVPAGSSSQARLATEGALVTYEVTLRGKGKKFPIGWELSDGDNGNVVAAERAVSLSAQSEEETSRRFLWVPRPKQLSLFRITLRVFRPGTPIGAQPLDSVDTPTFPGTHTGADIVVTFRVRKGGTGSGVVLGPDLTCGTFCSSQYGFGSKITLLAVPHLDSVFSRWEGVCGRKRQCTVVVGPITSIEARFAAKQP